MDESSWCLLSMGEHPACCEASFHECGCGGKIGQASIGTQPMRVLSILSIRTGRATYSWVGARQTFDHGRACGHRLLVLEAAQQLAQRTHRPCNCVPACTDCNTLKSFHLLELHPSRFRDPDRRSGG